MSEHNENVTQVSLSEAQFSANQLKNMDVASYKTFDLPTYEIVTPHTGMRFTVQSLTISQEEKFKGSNLTQANGLQVFNQILWECMYVMKDGIKTKPFTSFAEMENKLTLQDRLAVIYGIIISSYGEKQTFTVPSCPACNQKFDYEGDLSDPNNIHINNYTGSEPIIGKLVDIELPISKYHAFIKSPTLADERKFVASLGLKKEFMSKALEYITVARMAVPTESGKKYRNIDNILEIYSTLSNLSTRDRKFLNKRIMEEFGQYNISVKLPVKCPICSHETETEVNMLSELFRLSYQS